MAAPIRIVVGEGNRLTVTVPDMDKADLIDVVASLVARERQEVEARFRQLLAEAPAITLVVTSHEET